VCVCVRVNSSVFILLSVDVRIALNVATSSSMENVSDTQSSRLLLTLIARSQPPRLPLLTNANRGIVKILARVKMFLAPRCMFHVSIVRTFPSCLY
jgi:hypothetical protein